MGAAHLSFETQARLHPARCAIRFGDEHMSYEELDARADLLARHLLELGIATGSRVGICVRRGLGLPIAALATLKTGAAQVPVDPAHPPERLRRILHHAEVDAILIDSELDSLVVEGESCARVVHVDRLARDPAPVHGVKPNPDVTAADTAFILYTSGTTGRPKGVMLSHGTVAHHIAALSGAFRIGPGDVYLSTASTSFVMSLRQTLAPLSVGATVMLVPEDIARDPLRLFQTVKEREVSVIDFVPTFWKTCTRVLETLPAREAARLLDNRVRLVTSAGEPLPRSVATDWLRLTTRASLINTYGQTETCGSVFSHPIDPADRRADGGVPIGRPLEHARVLLVDESLEPVAVGEVGELCFSGPCLATGYISEPEMTAARFVRNPIDGSTMYRSGDRARQGGSGMYEFAGRGDLQVKIRGYRVEPGEVEAALREQQSVRDAAVVTAVDLSGDTRLIAYVVAAAHGAVGFERTVREHARACLPEYMIPSTIVELDALPVTSGGKLDRQALASRGAALRGRSAADALEASLVQIWSEILERPVIAVDASLFELGGHSLHAARIAARIGFRLDQPVPAAAVFDQPSIEALADYLRETYAASVDRLLPVGARADDATSRVPACEQTSAPVSGAQLAFWKMDRADRTGSGFKVDQEVELRGRLDRSALEAAVESIVQAHSILRTTYREVGGELHQFVAAGYERPPMAYADVSRLSADARALPARDFVDSLLAHRFDLEGGPPYRAGLLQLEPERHVFIFSAAHLGWDRQSSQLFWAELARRYTEIVERNPVRSGTRRPPQFIDYVAHRVRDRDTPEGQARLRYWDRQLAGAPPLELPVDASRQAVDAHREAAEGFGLCNSFSVTDHIGPRERLVLGEIARAEKSTEYGLMIAALATVLHNWTAQRDICFSAVHSARTDPELEGVLGCLLDWVILRIDLSGASTFRELVALVRGILLAADQHRDDRVITTVPHALRRVMINYMPDSEVDAEDRFGDLHRGRRHTHALQQSFAWDLAFRVLGHSGGLTLHLSFNEALFRKQTGEELVRRYRRLLQQIAADPSARLTDLHRS